MRRAGGGPMNEPDPPRHLILFDGRCCLCARGVVWLLARDRAGRLAAAPREGRIAAELRQRLGEFPECSESVLFYDSRTIHARSEAVLRALAFLPPPWSWLRFLRIVPRALRDGGYAAVARRRHRLASPGSCPPVPLELRARILP